MTRRTTIYFAAGLFSGRETLFNVELTRRLETAYEVLLPQRDGFEFGRLQHALANKIAAEDVPFAVQSIIYFLDMGHFLPRADVVVANLDEPLDEGVVVEISYGHLLGKYVVGYRTDVRSPFGSLTDPLVGMHFFPAYQCDAFLHHAMTCRDPGTAQGEVMRLAERIAMAIANGLGVGKKPAVTGEPLEPVVEGANLLFADIDDIHSPQGLETIAQRYVQNLSLLRDLGPEILRG